MWSIANLFNHTKQPVTNARRLLRKEPPLFFYLDGKWRVKTWSDNVEERLMNPTLHQITSAVEMAAWLNRLELEPLAQVASKRQVARIWYAKPEQSFFLNPEQVTLIQLEETHTLLMDLVFYPDRPEPMRALNFIFDWLQGENWSEYGQAQPLIQEKGLNHTSMSMGDVVEYQGQFYVVLNLGFGRLDAERNEQEK